MQVCEGVGQGQEEFKIMCNFIDMYSTLIVTVLKGYNGVFTTIIDIHVII